MLHNLWVYAQRKSQEKIQIKFAFYKVSEPPLKATLTTLINMLISPKRKSSMNQWPRF